MMDLAALLAPLTNSHLEEMASVAQQLTLRHFGRAIQLYTPMYLSNFCDNHCIYCGFNKGNDIERKRLTLEQVRKEAVFLSEKGFQHILILTGSSRSESPISYIIQCVKILKEYFASVSIEIYVLTSQEYKTLIDAGVDGLTIYQETYDREVYRRVHPKGPKSDYQFRLEAPERALSCGMRFVNIGALLGLSDWRKEAFATITHAKCLQDKYPESEISISVPRLRPYKGKLENTVKVHDSDLAQMIMACRIFLPRVGVTLSTRESAKFRENVLPLGVTRMSANSTTAVGGHTIKDDASSQFEISDQRNLTEIKQMLTAKGYQPVLKDWMPI
ncbi:MAG: 2-iminoacetate synthase ThiH [Candidatus Omnitrophica bacterium]|nr:2-iminoacetate synthase ThiH [Candidatus Omnitrophota bacterium]